MLIVLTGNGKGKTTAALGQAMRALGRGRAFLMIQFIKGPWISGEDKFAETYQIPTEEFVIKKMGLGFVGILDDKLPREKHEEAARKALAYFREEAKSGKWDVIALDEVNVAVSLGLLSAGDVLLAIREVPEEKLILLTGRDAPKEFIEAADLATEMRELKHPYNYGKWAEMGVEF